MISEEWPDQPHLTKREEIEDEEIKPVLQVTTVKKKNDGLSAWIDLKDFRREGYFV